MTVIVGMTDGEKWSIAADRGVSRDCGPSAQMLKVWRQRDSLVGMSGSGAAEWLVKAVESGDPYEMARHLIGIVPFQGWRLLVVRQEGCYEIDDNFMITPFDRKYAAIGGAEPFVLGVIATLEKYQDADDPERVVRYAAQRAIDNIHGCCGPVDVMTLHAEHTGLTMEVAQSDSHLCGVITSGGLPSGSCDPCTRIRYHDGDHDAARCHLVSHVPDAPWETWPQCILREGHEDLHIFPKEVLSDANK